MINCHAQVENAGQSIRFMASVSASEVDGTKWKQSGLKLDEYVASFAKDNNLSIDQLSYWELTPIDLMGQVTLWEMPWASFNVGAIYRTHPLDTAPAA